MNNKNYRVMKFFEPVNKQDKSRGYVRLDIRGIKGNILVSVENLGDARTTSEVYLYKDSTNKLKLGNINNKKGMLKRMLTFGSNSAIEDYNVCAVVNNNKIVMYSNLFNATSLEQIRKLEVDEEADEEEKTKKAESIKPKESEKSIANESKTIKEESKVSEETNFAENPQIPEKRNDAEESEMKEEKDVVKEPEVIEEKDLAHEPIRKRETNPVQKPKIKKEPNLAKEPEAKKEPNLAIENTQKEKTENDEAYEDTGIKKATVSSAINIGESAQGDEYSEEAKEKEGVQTQSRRYRNKFDESLYNVLKGYKQIQPLSVKINDLYWWYIPYDETGVRNGFLPYYSQIISSYYPYPMSSRVTTCSSLMRKYGHYIFGIYKENDVISKFVYGIPGEFTREEQPYKGITGFKNWSYGNKDNNDNYGYWLAFVNPKTGEITEPPQIVTA